MAIPTVAFAQRRRIVDAITQHRYDPYSLCVSGDLGGSLFRKQVGMKMKNPHLIRNRLSSGS